MGTDTPHISAARAAALEAENLAWMHGVADAVEPLGFDRDAACGPADLLPGLRTLSRIRELLYDFVHVEDTPCRYDHHGACQEHGWTEGPCGVAEARHLLRLDLDGPR